MTTGVWQQASATACGRSFEINLKDCLKWPFLRMCSNNLVGQ